MILYLAVTGDLLELPVFVADTAEEMAAWSGVKVRSVREMCSRNKNKPPHNLNGLAAKNERIRMRRVEVDEEEDD